MADRLSGGDRELVQALHAAVETLHACARHIEDLIGLVERELGSRGTARQPSPISFGAGPSVIAPNDRAGGISERWPGIERRYAREERRLAQAERPEAHDVAPAELMAATELAHLGYSREEIAERLRARWGDRAARILREALG